MNVTLLDGEKIQMVRKKHFPRTVWTTDFETPADKRAFFFFFGRFGRKKQ
jgi:hypothetical protein